MKSWIGIVTQAPATGLRVRRDAPGSSPIDAQPISTARAALAVGDRVLVLQDGPALIVVDKIN